MVEPAWFAHFRALPGKREILAPPGHGVVRIYLRTSSRVGVGVITSRERQRATDLEFEAYRLGVSVAELQRRAR